MKPWWRFLRFFAQWLFVLVFGGRTFGALRVPARGPVLLLCNHQSFLDPVLATLALHRESHFMARASLFRVQAFTRLIRSLNAFPVKPGRSDVGAFRQAMRVLKAGGCLTAFPEGTRTADGRLARPQPGLLAIARRCEAPIIPVVIEGAYEAWPRSARMPRPRRIVVEYGPAIRPEQAEQWSSKQLQDELFARWRVLQRGARRRLKRPAFEYAEPPHLARAS
jgi:1-acyl-sn-glycerol-3-phosphate acyltransferase